jgi:hypothetical protein
MTSTSDNNNVMDVTSEDEKEDPLQLAMQFADVIRRHENRRRNETITLYATARSDNKNQNHHGDTGSGAAGQPQLLTRLYDFLDTPGVKEGFISFALCCGVSIPTRRLVIRGADSVFKLGNIFPDLVITPPLVIACVQIPFYMGSLYGSKLYLDRFCNNKNMDMVLANSICRDSWIMSVLYDRHFLETHSLDNSDPDSWDPRQQTMQALHAALFKCRELHRELDNEQITSSAKRNAVRWKFWNQ